MKCLGRAVVLTGIAMVFALATNAVSPRGIPLRTPPAKMPEAAEFIPLQQAKQWWENGTAVFLDARDPADFDAGHIANAFNLPAASFETHFGEIASLLTPESPMVIYCDGTECELSHRVKDRLGELGYTRVKILFDGWSVWRGAGLPVEPDSENQLPSQ